VNEKTQNTVKKIRMELTEKMQRHLTSECQRLGLTSGPVTCRVTQGCDLVLMRDKFDFMLDMGARLWVPAHYGKVEDGN